MKSLCITLEILGQSVVVDEKEVSFGLDGDQEEKPDQVSEEGPEQTSVSGDKETSSEAEIEIVTSADIEPIPEPEGRTEIIRTDYEIGQDNISKSLVLKFEFDIHHIVFTFSALGVVAFTFIALALQNELEPVFTGLRNWLIDNLSWFFLLSGDIFVIVCLVLIPSPLGRIRLGGPKATPDYGYIGWFSMLFAAGMGIGLLFYGVSEPVSHYIAAFDGAVPSGGQRVDVAPLGGAEGNVVEAVRLSMAATIFHWSLHAWAVYAIVALSLALFSYNKGLPLTLRSSLYPILGERVWGWPGDLIDIMAIFATIFGLATSLGVGAQQISAGLDFLFGFGTSDAKLVMLIIGITFIALISVVRGIEGGVKVLSEINIGLAAILLLFIMICGPTTWIVDVMFYSFVSYIKYLPQLSNPFFRGDQGFMHNWTAFYLAWWISWSPFVGMFIARVSRGRTVREFLFAVLVIPMILTVVWMSALGGTAISQLVHEGFTGLHEVTLELKLFQMLTQLPMSGITSLIGIVLVVFFFITSSDSSSLVIDTIAAGGKVNAPVVQRAFWAMLGGVVAIALLLGGGITALQAMALSTGLPFTIVLLAASYSLIRGLINEPKSNRRK